MWLAAQMGVYRRAKGKKTTLHWAVLHSCLYSTIVWIFFSLVACINLFTITLMLFLLHKSCKYLFLTMPMACGSSRGQTRATAVMPDP